MKHAGNLQRVNQSNQSIANTGSKLLTTGIKFSCADLNLFYGEKKALKGINIDINANSVTALIGPSGCGKSTFLRCLNRMNDYIDSVTINGRILLDGKNIYHRNANVVDVRRRVGMVFQHPNPFPKSIYMNVAYAPIKHRIVKKGHEADGLVENSLKQAGLWDEVKDKLYESGLSLSGGQQQRLCIARAIATQPEVLLLDEPTSALDPISTAKIEELIKTLKNNYTIVMVTHNMLQAKRVSDYTAHFHLGEIVEYRQAKHLFESPETELTKRYVSGAFG